MINPNLFHILGIARNEMTHSAFIAWLLKGVTCAGLIPFDDGYHPLRLFLKCIGAKDEDLKGIESVETSTEKMLAELSENCNSAERLDIYVRVILKGKQDLEIFVENKVFSSENQNDDTKQTTSYYDALKSRNSSKYFVFLTVDGKVPSCDEFVPLSYQTLMDNVLVPLQATGRYNDLLREYITALETPAPAENGGKFDIMAMSANTKQSYEIAFKEQWENLGSEYKNKHAISNSLKSALCSACYAKSGQEYQKEPIVKLINSKDLSKFNVTIDGTTIYGCRHKEVAKLVVAKIVSLKGKKDAAKELNSIKGKGYTILVDYGMYSKVSMQLKNIHKNYELIHIPETDEYYWLQKQWDHRPDRESGNFDRLLKIVQPYYPDIIVEEIFN